MKKVRKTQNQVQENVASKRPDVFTYHDFRAFLKNWFLYLKEEHDFSMRGVSQEMNLAAGFLPMVLAGKRNMSMDTATRLAELIHLSPSERNYFATLVSLAVSSKDTKHRALSKLARSTTYKKRNPQEVEFLKYMSNWYFVAIREMAAIPGFQPDPEWIRERLNAKVPTQQIKQALDFLFEHGYLEKLEDGTISPPKDALDCAGPVFSGALTQYHRKMFALATDAIEDVSPDEKHVVGYTFALGAEQFEKLKKILDRTLDEIEKLEKESAESKDSVYQVELATFPLARDRKGKKS